VTQLRFEDQEQLLGELSLTALRKLRTAFRCSRRSSRGLTTLEWLLIVAAVAGLAALAVVLVQNVVDETAEEITGNSARETAARVAAARIDSDARDEIRNEITDGTAFDVDTLSAVNSDYKSKCDRLEITYSDIGADSLWTRLTMNASVDSSDQEAALTGNDPSCSIAP